MQLQVKTNLETMGSEIKNSIHERSVLECALHNTKSALKYLLECKKMFKGHEDEDVLISAAERALLSEYKENILGKQSVANKYAALYSEKFYKIKLLVEKELNI